jgi:hypothetical protein
MTRKPGLVLLGSLVAVLGGFFLVSGTAQKAVANQRPENGQTLAASTSDYDAVEAMAPEQSCNDLVTQTNGAMGECQRNFHSPVHPKDDPIRPDPATPPIEVGEDPVLAPPTQPVRPLPEPIDPPIVVEPIIVKPVPIPIEPPCDRQPRLLYGEATDIIYCLDDPIEQPILFRGDPVTF